MKYCYKIVLLGWVLLSTYTSWGQSKFLPTGIRAGFNLSTAGKTITRDFMSQYEVTGDIDFYKYLLNLDLGTAQFNYEEDDFTYNLSGSYFRTGIDINFVNNLPNSHALFMGARYARSFFNASVSWDPDDPYWPDQNISVEEENMRAFWFEIVGGMKVNVLYNFHLGFTARLKIARSYYGEDRLIPYRIPGYGPAEVGSMWGFDYYISYRIPFRKKPDVVEKLKITK
ncbi:MAG: DUF6048 family protein [Candidatus Cyclobacteriaceae bacterium M3_2C_046]